MKMLSKVLFSMGIGCYLLSLPVLAMEERALDNNRASPRSAPNGVMPQPPEQGKSKQNAASSSSLPSRTTPLDAFSNPLVFHVSKWLPLHVALGILPRVSRSF